MNFDIERRDTPSDPHGGVLIATTKELELSIIVKGTNLEMLSGTINLQGKKKMRIISYYRPPNRQITSLQNVFKRKLRS